MTKKSPLLGLIIILFLAPFSYSARAQTNDFFVLPQPYVLVDSAVGGASSNLHRISSMTYAIDNSIQTNQLISNQSMARPRAGTRIFLDSIATTTTLSIYYDLDIAGANCNVDIYTTSGFPTLRGTTANTDLSFSYRVATHGTPFNIATTTNRTPTSIHWFLQGIMYSSTGTSQSGDCIFNLKSLKINDGPELVRIFNGFGLSSASASSSTGTTTPTEGEVAIVTVLLALLIAHITAWLIYALNTVYKKRTYFQYGGGDVEKRTDL
jgi:hypothetical protein